MCYKNKLFNFLNLFPLFLNIIIFSSCLKQKNKNLSDTYYKLSILELSNHKCPKRSGYQKALEYINKAIAQNENPNNVALKATILFILNYQKTSKELFKKALSMQSNEQLKCEILNNYACLLASSGTYKDAIKTWKKLEYNSAYLTPEVACFNIGKVYFSKNMYENAQKYFSKAIFFSHDYIDAHYYFAIASIKIKDLKAAQMAAQTILHLEPTHKGAKQILKLLLQSGNNNTSKKNRNHKSTK